MEKLRTKVRHHNSAINYFTIVVMTKILESLHYIKIPALPILLI